MVATGRHQRDTPPVDGGRWPISVVLRPAPDSPLSRRLDTLTTEAGALAGPCHWQTGQAGSAHLTVRSLEGYRDVVPPADAAVRRYLTALQATAAAFGPLRFEVTGLTLTPSTVMAAAEPADDQPDRFAAALADALGEDAWHESGFDRDIWYLNLLHFTTTIRHPSALVDWVGTHRRRAVGQLEITAADLVRFRLAPGARPHMRPEPLATAPLGPPQHGTP